MSQDRQNAPFRHDSGRVGVPSRREEEITKRSSPSCSRCRGMANTRTRVTIAIRYDNTNRATLAMSRRTGRAWRCGSRDSRRLLCRILPLSCSQDRSSLRCTLRFLNTKFLQALPDPLFILAKTSQGHYPFAPHAHPGREVFAQVSELDFSASNSRQKKKPMTPTGANVPRAISRWRVPRPSQEASGARRNKNVTEHMRYVRKPEL